MILQLEAFSPEFVQSFKPQIINRGHNKSDVFMQLLRLEVGPLGNICTGLGRYNGAAEDGTLVSLQGERCEQTQVLPATGFI